VRGSWVIRWFVGRATSWSERGRLASAKDEGIVDGLLEGASG
jgi:hypothetical protein